MLDKTAKSADRTKPVIVKKYANRRLYNTETSTYVTLEDLAAMVRSNRDFVVYDAKSGDDLTHAVLTQIIVEQEGRAGGPNLLPIPFLRQLIRFYDDSMGKLVPGYLQFSLEALTREEDTYRKKLAEAWGPGGFDMYREHVRNNLKLFEQAMALWVPFKPGTGAESAAADTSKGDKASTDDEAPVAASPTNEIDALKVELAAMQQRIEKLSQNR